MIDVRTPIEKARAERHRKICGMFITLRNEQPSIAPHRVFSLIADQFGMTIPGVKSIIVRNGLYKTKS